MPRVLIDVRDEIVEDCKERVFENSLFEETDIAIKNGIVLDGLTNGEVIQKMFPDGKITEESYVVFAHIEECDHPFDKAWWNRKWGE